MNTATKILVIIIFGNLIILPMDVLPKAHADCGISITSPLDFGNVDAGDFSAQEILEITNTGSSLGTVDVYATNWINMSSENIVNGELTKFAFSSNGSSINYEDKIPLNNTESVINFGIIEASGVNSTYWQVQATVNESSFTGAVTQTMTFAISC